MWDHMQGMCQFWELLFQLVVVIAKIFVHFSKANAKNYLETSYLLGSLIIIVQSHMLMCYLICLLFK